MVSTIAPPQHKNVLFTELKATDQEKGIFEGYLSVYGNVDSYKDIVEPGAFTKTIKDARGRQGKYLFPLLWQHDPKDPIGGILDLVEKPKGLYIKGQVDLSIPRGQQAYSGLMMGYLDGLSFGYDTIKHKYNGDIRHLQEVRMWEGSVVTFPANSDTRVTGVKAACGSTSWPLGERDAAWDGSAAHAEIVKWASNDDGSVDVGKMKSVHFWVDEADAATITAYKMPFCRIVDGSPVASPKGIETCAAVMQGAMGGGKFSGDDDAMKTKIASYYRKMAAHFQDPTIVPPWKKDTTKMTTKATGKKHYPTSSPPRDFHSILKDRAPDEVVEDLYDMMGALMSSIMEHVYASLPDAECKEKVDACVDQFGDAVDDWLEDAWDAGLGGSGEDDAEPSVSSSPSISVSISLSGSLSTSSSVSGSPSASATPSASQSPSASASPSASEQMRKSLSLAHFTVSTRALKAAMRCYVKEGRTLSTSSRVRMSAALDSISSAVTDLQSMIDETDTDTNPGKRNPAPDKNPGTPASVKPDTISKPAFDSDKDVDAGTQPTSAQKKEAEPPEEGTLINEEALTQDIEKLLEQMRSYMQRG